MIQRKLLAAVAIHPSHVLTTNFPLKNTLISILSWLKISVSTTSSLWPYRCSRESTPHKFHHYCPSSQMVPYSPPSVPSHLTFTCRLGSISQTRYRLFYEMLTRKVNINLLSRASLSILSPLRSNRSWKTPCQACLARFHGPERRRTRDRSCHNGYYQSTYSLHTSFTPLKFTLLFFSGFRILDTVKN